MLLATGTATFQISFLYITLTGRIFVLFGWACLGGRRDLVVTPLGVSMGTSVASNVLWHLWGAYVET